MYRERYRLTFLFSGKTYALGVFSQCNRDTFFHLKSYVWYDRVTITFFVHIHIDICFGVLNLFPLLW
jgi:hypothetical protein